MKKTQDHRPIRCADVRVRLSTVHDGERDALEPCDTEHLDQCAVCRSFAAELVSLSALFDPLREVEPPPRLGVSVPQATPRTIGNEVSRATRLRARFARVAAALIGFLGVLLVTPSERAASPTGDEQPALDAFARATRSLRNGLELDAFPERELLVHLEIGKDK